MSAHALNVQKHTTLLDAGFTWVVKKRSRPVRMQADAPQQQSITHTLIIYGYLEKRKPPHDGTEAGHHYYWQVAYVGQTLRALEVRDAEHRGGGGSGGSTPFDVAYQLAGRDPQRFRGPVVLERVVRTAQVSTLEEQATFRAACQAWMDVRETHWIQEHGTYTNANGYNQTKGGQMGWDRAFFEAQLKASLGMFRRTYLPAFRAYLMASHTEPPVRGDDDRRS
jgi:hypothetical protein